MSMLLKRIAGVFLALSLGACSGAFPDENFWSVIYAFNEYQNGAPVISVSSPTDGSTSVSTNSAMIFAFSKVMNAGTVTVQASDGACGSTFQISSDDFASCAGGTLFTTDSQVFAFVPGSTLSGSTVYKIRILEGATDLSGNAMNVPFTMSQGFSTVSNLLLTLQVPTSGSTQTALNSTISLTFSRTMNTGNLFMQTTTGACETVSTIRVSNDNFATCLGGTLATGSNPTIVITMASTMAENSLHQVRVTTSALDSSKSGLQTQYTGTFTTFAPTNVGGGTLQAWLKADGQSFTDAGSTAAGNGDFVQQWNDNSGNSNHASQVGALNKPVLVLSQPAINNKPVMRFDGTPMPNDDNFDIPVTLNPLTTAFTALVVVKANTAPPVEYVLLSQTDGGGTGRTNFKASANCGGNPRFGSFLGATNTCSPLNIAASTWYIASITWDMTNVTVYSDGNAGTATARTAETAAGSWRIGSGKTNLLPLDGDIAEILFYGSSLSLTDLQRAECYLARKYALTISGHVCP